MTVARCIAVMQPYLFPYLGYFQLLARVQTFVFLDDVAFIKRGFVNRNFIRTDGAAKRFTLPVAKQSQNRRISEHFFLEDASGLVDSISRAYRRAPMYGAVMPLVASILTQADRRVSTLAARSVTVVADYLGLRRDFRFSSALDKDDTLCGQDRILDICSRLGATWYVNAIGGRDIYDSAVFRSRGIALEFVRMRDDVSYAAPGYPYIPNLSILDALMMCSTEDLGRLVEAYEIV